MDQIAIANNAAVHLLQGEGFTHFDQAEAMLSKAMVAMNGIEFSRGARLVPAARANTVSVNQDPRHIPQLPVRRGRDSISSRRSSATAASSTASVCDCEPFFASTMMEEEGDTFDDLDVMGFEDDDDEYDTIIAIESIELTQVDPKRGSGQHSVLPIFNRALLVDGTCAAYDEEIAAVLLYNLALIHHIKGMYLRRSDVVDKALKLYELAVTILQKSNTSKRNDFMVDELLVLALFYNLGQVNAQLMHFDKAGCYFAFLRTVLGDSNDENNEGAVLSLDDDDYSFFFFHAVIFQDGEQLPIAPAA